MLLLPTGTDLLNVCERDFLRSQGPTSVRCNTPQLANNHNDGVKAMWGFPDRLVFLDCVTNQFLLQCELIFNAKKESIILTSSRAILFEKRSASPLALFARYFSAASMRAAARIATASVGDSPSSAVKSSVCGAMGHREW